MSENMIILELLEKAHINFDEALRLINAVSQKSQIKDTHQHPNGESENGIKVNIHVERITDV